MMEEEFHTACVENNYEKVKALIEQGVDVNMISPVSNETYLWGACLHNHVDLVKLLLDNSANPNIYDISDAFALPPIYHGIVHAPEILKLLILHGAQVHVRDRLGNNLLHSAIGTEDVELKLQILLALGLDPNHINTIKVTCLWDAYHQRDFEALKTLLIAGADPDILQFGLSSIRTLAKTENRQDVLDLIDARPYPLQTITDFQHRLSVLRQELTAPFSRKRPITEISQ